MARAERRLLVTCEHGGHRLPPAYAHLAKGRAALLRSHRGWDPGALAAARQLARDLGAPLVAATTTRLLVDPNRSPHNPRVFSELGRTLAPEARAALLARHHRPHWDRVRSAISRNAGTTVHLAVHSFTPVWRGIEREFSIGILYDPKRLRERALARRWQRRLAGELPAHRIRRNAPYRGDSDGLTTALRREFASSRYLGLELELNQAVLARESERRRLLDLLEGTFREVSGCRSPRRRAR